MQEYSAPRQITAQVENIDSIWTQQAVSSVHFSKDRLDYVFDINTKIGTENDLGITMVHDEDKQHLKMLDCRPETMDANIPWWRTTLRHQYLKAINNKDIFTIQDVEKIVQDLRS